jgi:hypothetical protein
MGREAEHQRAEGAEAHGQQRAAVGQADQGALDQAVVAQQLVLGLDPQGAGEHELGLLAQESAHRRARFAHQPVEDLVLGALAVA